MSVEDQIDFRARDLYELQPGSAVTDFTKLDSVEQVKWYRLASVGLIDEINSSNNIDKSWITVEPLKRRSEPIAVQKKTVADPYIITLAILTLAAGAFLAFMAYHAVMKNGDIFTWNDILGTLFLFSMVDKLRNALELKQNKVKSKNKS
jgi:hypothetical protein